MFVIIETIEKRGPEVTAVPESWVTDSGKNVFWPQNIDGKNLRNFRKNQRNPESNWSKFPINRILFENIGN